MRRLGRLSAWRLPLLLAVVALALAAVVLGELTTPPTDRGAGLGVADDGKGEPGETAANSGTEGDDAETVDDADEGDALPAGSRPLAIAPLSEFASVVERPLFSRSRRPAPPGAAATDQETTGSAQAPFILSGIVIAGATRVALLQGKTLPKLVRVVEGDTVEGWKVVSIRPQGVLVRSGDRGEELKLQDRIAGHERAPSPAQPRQLKPSSERPRGEEQFLEEAPQ